MSELLRPYLSRLAIDWLRRGTDTSHLRQDGTLVFADISGFTSLTERLAQRGKAGAEEMGDVLNATFGALLADAYEYGAGLLKWGGDAVLLLFDPEDGEDHAARACRAAWEMQRTIARIGRRRTSVGPVTLRMSVGIHTGQCDFFLVGSRHKELIVTGTAATMTAAMEQIAQATEIVVSQATVAAVGDDVFEHHPIHPSSLITACPDVEARPATAPDPLPLPDLRIALPRAIAEHLSVGLVDYEHRQVVTGFVQFSGVDVMLDGDRGEEIAAALEELVDVADQAADRNGVTFLATDIATDGGKVILAAGVPRTWGDSEQRLLCALRQILDSPSRLALRAGASRGRVFVGDFGLPYRRTYSIVGDSVNLAARLMARADVKQLLVSPDVVEATRRSFPVQLVQPFVVKGKAEPIVAVAVNGLPDDERPAADVEASPFVGRRTEMMALSAALTAARGGRGQAVEIVGEAGMGKSRLLVEFLRQINCPRHIAVCDVYGASVPYAPLRRLLRSALALPVEADDQAIRAALTLMVDRRRPELRPWLPLVAPIIGTTIPMTPEVEALEEPFRRSRLAETLVDFLDAVMDGPAMLVFGDVQYMDDASAGLLRHVTTSLPTRPWLLVVTRRPGDQGLGLDSAPHVTRLVLPPLDDAASEALLDGETEASPLPIHEANAIRAKASGNPLYLKELVAARGRWGSVEALPESIEEVIAVQIDRLDTQARTLIRAASVLGGRCDREIVNAIVRGEGLAILPEAWVAIEHFVESRDDGGLVFRQALVRETAYESLPYKQRKRLHELAARAIEQLPGSEDAAGVLAMHYFSAQRFGEALVHAQRAAQQAESVWANVDGARFYEQAIESARRSRGRDARLIAELATCLGRVWFRIGDLARAEAAFRMAHRHASDGDFGASVKRELADTYVRMGKFPDALRWFTRALNQLGGSNPSLAATVCVGYAWVRHHQGRAHEASRWAHRAASEALAARDQRALGMSYQLLDLLSHDGAENYAAKALAIFEELENLPWTATSLNQLGLRSYYAGDWDQAQGMYDRARAIYERIGNSVSAADETYNSGEILADQGHLDEAEVLTRQALRVFRAAESPGRIGWATYQLGVICARAGRSEEALGFLESARTMLSDAGEAVGVAQVDCRICECLALAGRSEEALECVDALLAAATAGSPGAMSLPLVLRARGIALGQLQQDDRAVNAWNEAVTAARQRRSTYDVALTLDAMVQHAVARGQQPDPNVQTERDELFATMGLAEVPRLMFDAERVPVAGR